ncbi:MAG TPA: ATPase, T2SS/T4P/T4SS family, partial [Spirochaetia bacterium]|nr:ATPase, T2SS/T4P/T4SS family [Spirochaetia bacterium]
MNRLENNNRMSIEMLNQRGGRMLSLVDLLEAGTLNLELAAEMAYVVSQGGSMITAAGPGGVGKTTLMGALLAFLPPDTEIVTVEGENTLYNLDRRQPGHCQCLVVHEIGPGSYHGYLWGKSVARYFNL